GPPIRAARPSVRSARPADRADQVPLAHLRAAGNVLLLGDLVELLAVSLLERMPRLAAALPSLRGLLAELAAGARGQVRDRPLAPRCALGLLHVLLRGLDLFRRRHFDLPGGFAPFWRDRRIARSANRRKNTATRAAGSRPLCYICVSMRKGSAVVAALFVCLLAPGRGTAADNPVWAGTCNLPNA